MLRPCNVTIATMDHSVTSPKDMSEEGRARLLSDSSPQHKGQELQQFPSQDYSSSNLENSVKCRVSWSVRWRSAKQHLTVWHQESPDSEAVKVDEVAFKKHHHDVLCQPGSQYKATIKTESVCCVPLTNRTVNFLTKGICTDTKYHIHCHRVSCLFLYMIVTTDPPDDLCVILDHIPRRGYGILVVSILCGEYQQLHIACYRCKDRYGQDVPKKKTTDMQSLQNRGKERSLRIDFTKKKQSGTYEVIIETLPHQPITNLLKIPKATESIEITVKGQSLSTNYNYSNLPKATQ